MYRPVHVHIFKIGCVKHTQEDTIWATSNFPLKKDLGYVFFLIFYQCLKTKIATGRTMLF